MKRKKGTEAPRRDRRAFTNEFKRQAVQLMHERRAWRHGHASSMCVPASWASVHRMADSADFLVHRDDGLGAGELEGTQGKGVEEGEDRRVEADAEAQRENGDSVKPGLLLRTQRA